MAAFLLLFWLFLERLGVNISQLQDVRDRTSGLSVVGGLWRLLQAGVARSAQMFCAACYFLCWRLWVRLLLPKCLCEIISESYICIIYNLSDNQNIQHSANDYTKFSNTLLQHNIITLQTAIYYFDRVLHASCDVRTSSLLLF